MTMENNTILFEQRDGLAFLTLNRPEVRNALNVQLQRELIDVIEYVNMSEDIKVVILTGAGDKAFAAGSDISGMKDRTMLAVLNGIFAKAVTCLAECEKPVIAAVNGAAYGGGCELALAADIRIASDTARFALPETGLGIMPGGGGCRRLATLIGMGRAKEMVFTGRSVGAEEALRIGLVTGVYPQEQLSAAVLALAEKIMEKGPFALRMAKKVLNLSQSVDEQSGRLLELFSYCMLIASEDRVEGINAFLEKRKPDFKGR